MPETSGIGGHESGLGRGSAHPGSRCCHGDAQLAQVTFHSPSFFSILWSLGKDIFSSLELRLKKSTCLGIWDPVSGQRWC